MEAEWLAEDVRRVQAFSERWRYRLCDDSLGPRERALRQAGLTSRLLKGDRPLREEREENPDFPEVEQTFDRGPTMEDSGGHRVAGYRANSHQRGQSSVARTPADR